MQPVKLEIKFYLVSTHIVIITVMQRYELFHLLDCSRGKEGIKDYLAQNAIRFVLIFLGKKCVKVS